jgi:hypothetical protein
MSAVPVINFTSCSDRIVIDSLFVYIIYNFLLFYILLHTHITNLSLSLFVGVYSSPDSLLGRATQQAVSLEYFYTYTYFRTCIYIYYLLYTCTSITNLKLSFLYLYLFPVVVSR